MELKIAILIVIVSVTNVFAIETYSQTARVSLDMENTTLEKVMDEIERQSEFYFIFNQKKVDVGRIVTIKLENKLIDEILSDLFYGTDVSYTIIDRKILLTTESIEDNLKVNGQVIDQQQISISGTITDASTGAVMPGVNILVKGTIMGAIADASGKYSLNVTDPNSVLVFSFIGYTTKEISISGRSIIDLVLEPELAGLDEVVVVGYGTQKKTSLTAAISTLKSDKIGEVPVTNISNSFGGRVSGVIVKQTTGDPGRDESSIFIRGISSTGGNQPLVIVDGIPRSFSRLDPNTIETFTILKDAAAVAPYGVAGANGVILVTTKKGKAGDPLLKYNGYVGFQNPTVLPKFTNSYQYALLRNAAAQNEGLPIPYSDGNLLKLKNHTDPDAWPDPNVWDLINRNALLTRHNFEISGGTDKVTYYGSLGYQHQNAMFSTTNDKKYNLALNMDAHVTGTTTIHLGVNGAVQNSTYPSIAPGRIWELLQYVNTRRGALYFSNGLPGDKIPATIYGSGYNKINTMNLFSQFSIEQDLPFIPGLKAQGTISYDPSITMDKLWRTPTYITSIKDTTQHPYEFVTKVFDQPKSSLDQAFRQSYQLTYQTSLFYIRSFGKSNVSALTLFEAKDNSLLSLGASRRNYNLDIDEISMGSSSQADMSTSGSSSAARQVGFLYRVTYNYGLKYSFEASGRYDGHYYFAPGKRFGFFPAFSLGWRLSEENFMKGIDWIESLKIRGSYGEVGALAGAPFQFLSTYSAYGPAYVLGGQAVQAANERNESNPNITWERARKSDVGIEAILWKGLLRFEADYFYEKRSNMLVSPNVIVPEEYGIGLSQVNAGIMKNQGIDLSFGSSFRLFNDFQVTIDGNFTYAKNTLLKVFENPATYDNPNRRLTGKSLGTQFGYHALGFFQLSDFNSDATLKEGIAVQPWGTVHPGDLRYEDIDNDGIIDVDDLTKIGEPATPQIMYGLTANIIYKGFYLDLLFQGAGKTALYLDRHMQWPFYNSMNAYVDNLNYWTPDNPNAKHPRVTNAPTTNNSQKSSWWITDVSYLRLKSATLAYSIPAHISEKIKIQNLRIYISGQNLLTFTNLINFDPENAGAYTNLYPLQKVVSLGLNVTF